MLSSADIWGKTVPSGGNSKGLEMSQSRAEGPEFHPESHEVLRTEALLSSPQPLGLQKMTCPRESPPSTNITDQGAGDYRGRDLGHTRVQHLHASEDGELTTSPHYHLPTYKNIRRAATGILTL